VAEARVRVEEEAREARAEAAREEEVPAEVIRGVVEAQQVPVEEQPSPVNGLRPRRLCVAEY
jgi:hypothetical protein